MADSRWAVERCRVTGHVAAVLFFVDVLFVILVTAVLIIERGKNVGKCRKGGLGNLVDVPIVDIVILNGNRRGKGWKAYSLQRKLRVDALGACGGAARNNYKVWNLELQGVGLGTGI